MNRPDINNPNILSPVSALNHIGPYLQDRFDQYFRVYPFLPDDVVVTLDLVRQMLIADYEQLEDPDEQRELDHYLQNRNTYTLQEILINERRSTCVDPVSHIERGEYAPDGIGDADYGYCVRDYNHYGWWAIIMYMTTQGYLPAEIMPDPNKPRYTRCQRAQPFPYCRR